MRSAADLAEDAAAQVGWFLSRSPGCWGNYGIGELDYYRSVLASLAEEVEERREGLTCWNPDWTDAEIDAEEQWAELLCARDADGLEDRLLGVWNDIERAKQRKGHPTVFRFSPGAQPMSLVIYGTARPHRSHTTTAVALPVVRARTATRPRERREQRRRSCSSSAASGDDLDSDGDADPPLGGALSAARRRWAA